MKIKVIEYNNSVDVIINKYENEKKAIDRFLETRYKGESSFLKRREEDIERVNRRRKKRIRELIKVNDFCYFITLTFKEDLDNKTRLDVLKKYLKKMKRIEKDLQYLVVPEEHKNGKLHFHCLFSNEVKQFISLNKNNKLSLIGWEISVGFTNVQRVKSIDKVLKYIIKYITKENKYTYFRSRNLNNAPVKVLFCSSYISSKSPNFVDIFINLFLDLDYSDLENFNFIDQDGCIFRFNEI